jgi:RND family efflux transporter MFP subunit
MRKIPLLLLSCFVFMACSQDKNTYQPPPPPKVTVAKPVIKEITAYSYFTGTTSAYNSADLQAQVSGYLQKINFASGDKVKKGDLLFVIDPDPYRAELDQAKADLAVKQADLELAKTTLQRKQAAYEERAVSEVEVIEARAKQEKAVASVQAAKARIEEARINLDYTHIRAPFEGRISRNLVDVGNLITASTHLATIVDDNPMYVYFDMSEKKLLQFMDQARAKNATADDPETGHPVYLGLENETGYPHQGRIDYSDIQVDKSTGTVELRGVFQNKKRSMLPGMFVRVRLPIKKIPRAALVPDAALGADQRGSYLLTVDKDNKVVYTPVKTGPVKDGMRVINSGLKPGASVIIKGLQQARPGAEVSPVSGGQNSTSTGADK